MKNKRKERAIEILDIYINKIKNFPFIKSVILVGSLSDDTYTGNSGSDIDLVHVISNDMNLKEARKQVFDLLYDIQNSTNNDIPFSKTVYRYEDLFHPYQDDFELTVENKDYIELPVEILRIKDTGKVIYGDNIIDCLENPTKEDMIKSNELSKRMTSIEAKNNPEWYKNYIEMCAHPTPNILVQIVISNALRDYFMITGNNCCSKYRILNEIIENLPEYHDHELLVLCHKWRFNNSTITQKDIDQMNHLYEKWKIFRNK